MTAINFIPIVVGIFAAAMIWLMIADYSEKKKFDRCVCSLGAAACPRCKKVLGKDGTSSAKRRMIKFTSNGFKRLRGRDYPSRLVTVRCPNCFAEIEFRL